MTDALNQGPNQTPTLFGVSPDALRRDVYFLPAFWALHADPDPTDRLEQTGFLHGAAIRAIPGIGRCDLETPYGYGGPVADSDRALADGLAAWRDRQRRAGHVAEFVRLHPCLDPRPLAGLFDHLQENRLTVMVELGRGRAARFSHYGETTRQLVRKTRKTLQVRRLDVSEWPLFRALYEAMLVRHQAERRHFFPEDYYRRLFQEAWCLPLVAESQGQAIAAACFLATDSPVVHYHLSGGLDEGLRQSAHYLLIDEACERFEALGKRWLHLGGGRTPAPDDGLWLFKAKFSRIHARFHVGGLIHDRETYQALGGSRNGQFLGYRSSSAPFPIPTI